LFFISATAGNLNAPSPTPSSRPGPAVILEIKIQSLRVTFTFLLYRLLGLLAFPLLLLYAARRVAANSRYRHGLAERFGFLDRSLFGTKPSGIWLHAVSVGEVLSSISLIRELKRRLPETAVFVSVATLAGRELADQRLAGLADGVFFAPVDMAFAVRRVIRTLNPILHINLETELWPNRLRELQRSGAKVAQVNARISDKAWPSYQRLRWFWPAVLAHIDWLSPQSPADLDRFRALGYTGPAEAVGSLKFDFEPSAKPIAGDLQQFLASWLDRPLWVAASTVGATSNTDIDEEDAVLDAYLSLGNHVRLLLAPRKPERFAVVAEKIRARGIPFFERTSLAQGSGGILLLNTLGELSALYAHASVVFVGGSLCRWGGHNILEPAWFGKPILTGPYMQNFAAIQQQFLAAEAVAVVESPAQLPDRLRALLEHGDGLGARAQSLANSLRGVSQRLADRVIPLAEQGLPLSPLPAAGLTRPLTFLWKLAAARPITPRRLPARVVSVGNLSMGGTGKTPVTLALAGELVRRGHRVAILTRGYRRQSRRQLILLPGEQASPAETGDEAQLFLRDGRFAVGIGADRYQTGRALLDRFEADFLLLDDGFQHRQLHRDFDLVLIDSLLPFPGGDVPPAGLLREPLDALRRAHAFLFTKTQAHREYTALRQLLPPHAPVFTAEERVTLTRPVEDPSNSLAFCGLGNPAGFRLSLDRLGLHQVPLAVFPDHHNYSLATQNELRLRAHTLITTEKDLTKWKDSRDLVRVRHAIQLPPPLIAAILEEPFLPPQGAERT
jgi:tetraacyldisaccharide 4'-kinase